MKHVTIMQPAYLPWLGFFDRVLLADYLIILDHVPIDKNSKTKFANRNRIRQGDKANWLTIPVLARGEHAGAPLNAIGISPDHDWQRKHLASLRGAYAKAPCFRDLFAQIEAIISAPAARLMDVTEPLNRCFLQTLAIETPVAYSSDMEPKETKSALIAELCAKAGATHYISGPFGRDYLDCDAFKQQGIEVLFHDYRHPKYAQFQGEPFMPYMCIADLLFNVGTEALSILRTDRSALVNT